MKKWVSGLGTVIMVVVLSGCTVATNKNSEKQTKEQTYFSLSETWNIITDRTTKLQWENDRANKMSLEDAKVYCENLTLDGYSDWRLPSLNEFASLIEPNKLDAAKNVFRYFSFYYWTSTKGPFKMNPCYIDLNEYSDDCKLPGLGGMFRVRCVRGGE